MEKEKLNVVISGCTSGIGKELCRLYRADGHNVIGLARSAVSPDVAVDVTDAAALESAIDDIGKECGRIDTVIACAGGGLSGASELLPLSAIDEQIKLNFDGAVHLVQCALKFMQEGGKAIFISSACALFALPYRAMYCASKAAVNMAAFGMYMELKDKGIKVSSICPGDIKTNFSANRVKYNDGGARYGDAPQAAANKIDSREDKRMAVGPASQKIYKYCKKCNKPLYIIGRKYKMLNFLQRVLPRKKFLDITAKMFG